MVRCPQSEKTALKRGAWSPEEDHKLISYINKYGIWNWTQMPKPAGLRRSGKSCRLRWVNYLRPDIKRGNFSKEEEKTILNLHQRLGNRWSAIAAELPGRTDNEIKNFWNTRLKKCMIKNQSPQTAEELQAEKISSIEANKTNLPEIDLIFPDAPKGSNPDKIPMSQEMPSTDVCSPGKFGELLQSFWPCPTEDLYMVEDSQLFLQEPICHYPCGFGNDFWAN